MPKIVTTARGEALNFDALILKSKRPGNYAEPASTIAPPKMPTMERAVNLRGFMPAQSTAEMQENPYPATAKVSVVAPEATSKPALKGADRSVADFTKIEIDQTDSIRIKDGATPAPGDGTKLAEKILNLKRTGDKTIHEKKVPKTVLDDLDEGIES